jgi:hypothetical protein
MRVLLLQTFDRHHWHLKWGCSLHFGFLSEVVQVFPGRCEAHEVRGGPGLREANFCGLASAIPSCFVMVCGVERDMHEKHPDTRELK